MNTPIQHAKDLQEVVELIEQSHYYTLFSPEMSAAEKQLLLAAPSAVAHCLASSSEWMEQPKTEIELLLLNPGQLDAIDEGRSWGILNYLLGLSSLLPIHLTIVGSEIDLATSNSNSEELRSITVTKHFGSPIEFLIENPQYRADAAFLLHPSIELSTAGISALRELQLRGTSIYGTHFNSSDSQQLEQKLVQRGIAQIQWQQSNPFALSLEQFNSSDTSWAGALWHVEPQLYNVSPDCQISDLTRQTVLNIIEGGEMVTEQYLSDLQQEQSALTTMLHLLALLDSQSRSELTAHLIWNLFTLIRQGDVVEQRNELMRLAANLNWLGAAEEWQAAPPEEETPADQATE